MCLHNTYVTAADIINYNSASTSVAESGRKGWGQLPTPKQLPLFGASKAPTKMCGLIDVLNQL